LVDLIPQTPHRPVRSLPSQLTPVCWSTVQTVWWSTFLCQLQRDPPMPPWELPPFFLA
jgi:hypothetical protein